MTQKLGKIANLGAIAGFNVEPNGVISACLPPFLPYSFVLSRFLCGERKSPQEMRKWEWDRRTSVRWIEKVTSVSKQRVDRLGQEKSKIIVEVSRVNENVLGYEIGNRAVNRESVIARSCQWEFEVEVSRPQRDSTFSSMGI